MLENVSIDKLSLKNKKVLVRVDFNVPLDNGEITDDWRINSALPTIEKIIKSGGIPILISHLGRPKGQKVKELSLEPVSKRLSQLLPDNLGANVIFIDDCIGEKVENAIKKAKIGDCFLLENLRFYKEETDNNPDFSKNLSRLADVYIDDAFATAHREHASTVGVIEYFDEVGAGYLLIKEIKNLGYLLESPKEPFTAILGGIKLSTKLKLIEKLLPKINRLVIGGGMSFTFFKALGLEIGKAPYEEEFIMKASKLLQGQGLDSKILLPVDLIVSDSIDNPEKIETVSYENLQPHHYAPDIGDHTIELFKSAIFSSETIFVNGPMGVFEKEQFEAGTMLIFEALVKAVENGTFVVAGGGDTLSALKKFGFRGKLSWESTGGGASLKFIENGTLPAIEALLNKK